SAATNRTAERRRHCADQPESNFQRGRRQSYPHQLRARRNQDVLRTRRADLHHRIRSAVVNRNRYSSPLAERYASQAMLELWSPVTRHGLWRRLWLALAEAERELGVAIPDEGSRQMPGTR